jgi:prepilin-type N-terminal cleavage/methylation domain-containing protein
MTAMRGRRGLSLIELLLVLLIIVILLILLFGARSRQIGGVSVPPAGAVALGANGPGSLIN